MNDLGATTPAPGGDHRRDSIVVVVAVAMLCVFYGVSVKAGTVFHYDHRVFADTIEYQRSGLGYYDAYGRAFADRGVQLSEARAVRQPLIFLLWRWIPAGLLWPAYLALVTTIAATMTRLIRHVIVVVPVAAYFLLAGRIPSDVIVEQWLLVELWAVLPLTLSMVALRRGRHGRAAGWAAAAFLIREIALGYLLLAAAVAMYQGTTRVRAVWSAWIVAALGGYLLHLRLALDHLAPEGNEAVVLGTGRPPRTLWEMAAWMVPGPAVVGVMLMGVAVWRVAIHRRDLLPLLGLFAIVAGGLVVARPYWGFLFIPFGLLLAGEQLTAIISSRRTVGVGAEPEIH